MGGGGATCIAFPVRLRHSYEAESTVFHPTYNNLVCLRVCVCVCVNICTIFLARTGLGLTTPLTTLHPCRRIHEGRCRSDRGPRPLLGPWLLRGAVEVQGGVGFGEVVVGADLHRAVAGVAPM